LFTGLLKDTTDVGYVGCDDHTRPSATYKRPAEQEGKGLLVRNTNKFDGANLCAWYINKQTNKAENKCERTQQSVLSSRFAFEQPRATLLACTFVPSRPDRSRNQSVSFRADSNLGRGEANKILKVR